MLSQKLMPTMVIMAMEDMVMVMDMPAVMLAVLSMATLDMVDMDMVLDTDTDMDMAISARDLLSHMVLLFMAMLWELLDTLVMPQAMSAQLSMVTQEAIFWARGQLMLNLLLKLMLMLTMVLMVMEVMDMQVMDMLMEDLDMVFPDMATLVCLALPTMVLTDTVMDLVLTWDKPKHLPEL